MVQSALWQVPVKASMTTLNGRGLAPTSRLSATAMIKTIKRPGTAKARAAVVEDDMAYIPDMIMIVIIVIDSIRLC